ncbi:MAG TPA: MFS transporter [Xanthobacteraceae bacterium]
MTAIEAPASLKRHKAFALFWVMRVTTTGAYYMQAVAIGWQIYDMTGNPLDLGLVGLVQFFPLVLLAVVVGQIIDRYDRRAIARTCQIVKAACALVLAFGSAHGWLGREAIFAILLVVGTARAFETPTLHALVPSLVPPPLLPRAVAASATANQTAIICGPALGGLIYAFGPTTVYVTCAFIFTAASVLVSLLPRDARVRERKPVTFQNLFAGFGYIRNHPILFGVISLDLFVVMLGGVTAMLPVYARDVLQTGPWGLGLLRSAPALGALAMSVVLAHAAIERRAGLLMLATTAVFGVSILVFALSTSLVLSMAALTVYGATDAVSVVIRMAMVQTRTPHDMLGRVMAVNSACTGTSGTLGEFRAGVIAAGFGAATSVLLGGVGAILVVLVWVRLFPELARIKSVSPEAAER